MAKKPGSLVSRLVVITAIMLTVALGLTGFSLDRGFRESARTALRDRLEAHLYGLMGLVEITEDGTVTLPDNLAEPKLAAGDSGLYAAIWDARGRLIWRSPSALGQDLAEPPATVVPGHQAFSYNGSHETYGLALPVRWEISPEVHHLLVFTVAETADRFNGELTTFRHALWGWLAASAAFLVIAHIALLRLGLKPLLRLATDVKAIEAGRKDRFPADYPLEIRPLSDNLNALLDQDRARLTRYRDSLAELAHSLKTPLSILHGLGEELRPPPPAGDQMREQLDRMQAAVDYHLQRAATAGRVPLSATVKMLPLVTELQRTLDKVHDGKRVACTVDVSPDLGFRGDRGDLIEMLGNLMDNAWKWCAGRVRVTIREAGAGRRDGIEVTVEDDGPGVDPQSLANLGERGFRPRTEAPGHGIGLAVVASLAEEYGEAPHYARSELGGLRVMLHLST